MVDDNDPKVVNLGERLKGRGKDPAGTSRAHLRAEMVTIVQAAIQRMHRLGATSDEMIAQLESAVRDLRRKR